MRPLLLGALIGFGGLFVGSLLIWWLAASDTSFSSRWLTVAAVLPLLGVYFAWEKEKKEEAISPPEGNPLVTRAQYIVLGGVLAGLSQYLAFIIASSIWNADMIDPAQSGFFAHLFNPGSLPGLTETPDRGSSSESGWIEMTLIGLFVGAFVTFLLTRKPKESPAQGQS